MNMEWAEISERDSSIFPDTLVRLYNGGDISACHQEQPFN
jgi:hypothetical protein